MEDISQTIQNIENGKVSREELFALREQTQKKLEGYDHAVGLLQAFMSFTRWDYTIYSTILAGAYSLIDPEIFKQRKITEEEWNRLSAEEKNKLQISTIRNIHAEHAKYIELAEVLDLRLGSQKESLVEEKAPITCDFCNQQIEHGTGSVYSPAEVKEAATKGYRPSFQMTLLLGGDVLLAESNWLKLVDANVTNWHACEDCATSIDTVLGKKKRIQTVSEPPPTHRTIIGEKVLPEPIPTNKLRIGKKQLLALTALILVLLTVVIINIVAQNDRSQPREKNYAMATMQDMPTAQKVSDQTLLAIRTDHIQIQEVVFSPNGKYLAVSGDSNTVDIYEVRTGELVFSVPDALMPKIEFTSDGDYLAIANSTGLRMIKMSDGTEWKKSDQKIFSRSATAFSNDGRKIYILNSKPAEFLSWDIDTAQMDQTPQTLILPPEYEQNYITEMSTQGDNQIAFILLDYVRKDLSLGVWTIGSTTQSIFPLMSGAVNNYLVEFAGDFLVLAKTDRKTVTVFNALSGSQIFYSATGIENKPESVSISSDGQTIAILDREKLVYIWNTASSELTQKFIGTDNEIKDWVDIDLSDDGKLLAVGSGRNIQIWSLDS